MTEIPAPSAEEACGVIWPLSTVGLSTRCSRTTTSGRLGSRIPQESTPSHHESASFWMQNETIIAVLDKTQLANCVVSVKLDAIGVEGCLAVAIHQGQSTRNLSTPGGRPR
jgi:hypothetical protein